MIKIKIFRAFILNYCKEFFTTTDKKKRIFFYTNNEQSITYNKLNNNMIDKQVIFYNWNFLIEKSVIFYLLNITEYVI